MSGALNIKSRITKDHAMALTNDQLWEQMLQYWPELNQPNSDRPHDPGTQPSSEPTDNHGAGPDEKAESNESQAKSTETMTADPSNLLESPSLFELDGSLETQIELPIAFQLQQILDQ